MKLDDFSWRRWWRFRIAIRTPGPQAPSTRSGLDGVFRPTTQLPTLDLSNPNLRLALVGSSSIRLIFYLWASSGGHGWAWMGVILPCGICIGSGTRLRIPYYSCSRFEYSCITRTDYGRILCRKLRIERRHSLSVPSSVPHFCSDIRREEKEISKAFVFSGRIHTTYVHVWQNTGGASWAFMQCIFIRTMDGRIHADTQGT